MDSQPLYDKLARCNRCGFCQTACPIFRATAHEAGVARGRLALLRALMEKRIEWTEDLKEPLFNCLLCGACTANCFPAVATADLILDARTEYLERVGRSSVHRLLFDHLLPYPRRLRLAARAVAFGKKTGLSKLAKALGLLRAFGRDLPRAEDIVQRVPERTFREQVLTREVAGTGQLRIGYFVGCGTDVMCPESAEATLGILRSQARTVTVLENCCCGLPPLAYGDRAASQSLAKKNLELFESGQFDVIVTDCSSCAGFLKKYPTLFREDDPPYRVATAHAARVRDVLQVLPQGASPPSATVVDTEKNIVTYHDPCHACRGQGIVSEPREQLRRLPGVEYRELPEADWCCGGAGSYALAHYDLSQQVLDRKLDNLERTCANLLVTSCPACIVQLRYGIRKRGLPVRVCHIAELVPSPTATDTAGATTGNPCTVAGGSSV
jgi:glycolate oxidase iron-sulfur subunit